MVADNGNTTRGGLEPATITECEENGDEIKKKSQGIVVNFHFNPSEYTVSQSHSYTAEFKNHSDVPDMKFSKPGERTLSLKLVFDSYIEKKDVSRETAKIWQLMQVSQDTAGKDRPPPVMFEWGPFLFKAVIKSVTQKFTLFLKDGTPVRAELDVSLAQHKATKQYTWQNPTSGGGPLEQVWQVQADDRLDLIASEVYGDSAKWRRIADFNDIANPFMLRSGQRLKIPQL